jgi:hypothetical protein
MAENEAACAAALQSIDITAFAHVPFSRSMRLGRGAATMVLRGALWIPVFLAWALAIEVFSYVLPVRILDPLGLIALIALIGAVVFWGIRHVAASSTELGTLGSEADFPAHALDQMVPQTGITLRALLGRTREFISGLGAHPMSIPTPRDAAVRRWRLLGSALAIGALSPFAIPAFKIQLLSGPLGGAVAGAVTSIAIIAGAALLRRAAALAQPSVDELRAVDPRRPILLLRSFRDDRLLAWQRMRTFSMAFDRRKRFEQALARTLQQLGPLVAVGAPDERVPQLGAARSYLLDAEWQDRVLAWMNDSLAIIMIAGSTDWIRWELHRAVERHLEHNLMILLPPDRASPRAAPGAGRDARWQNVCAALADTAWSPALAAVDVEHLLLCRLKPDGRVWAMTSGSDLAQDYQLAIILAIFDAFCRPAN